MGAVDDADDAAAPAPPPAEATRSTVTSKNPAPAAAAPPPPAPALGSANDAARRRSRSRVRSLGSWSLARVDPGSTCAAHRYRISSPSASCSRLSIGFPAAS
eukprot:31544-Pelagococcus_subviridis.AAC.10